MASRYLAYNKIMKFFFPLGYADIPSGPEASFPSDEDGDACDIMQDSPGNYTFDLESTQIPNLYSDTNVAASIASPSAHIDQSPEEHILIDDMMIPFKGRSRTKQYIRGKPKLWGFKVWVKAKYSEWIQCFEFYSGRDKNLHSALGTVGDDVLRLIVTYDDNITVVRWMDNKEVRTISSFAGTEP
ncbi:hypothetical protein PR048_022050 [Dryococelus australis]|uniref:PiggyBac transposable element-derived protein domain-containing protein n=1 Tax=Dryococelus australis TaxID=614101 RepID=A0ABQ9H000_9NEOP|nr:hypothetical protein PR048_022050 [Dryococelus australis]